MYHKNENDPAELEKCLINEIDDCINELHRIVSESKSAQASALSSEATQIVPLNQPWSDWEGDVRQHFQSESQYRYRTFAGFQSRRKEQKPHIGLRARLKGVKTPSPQKRQADEDSPQFRVFWESPEKEPPRKILAVRNLNQDIEIAHVMANTQTAHNGPSLVKQVPTSVNLSKSSPKSPSKQPSPHKVEPEKQLMPHLSGQKCPPSPSVVVKQNPVEETTPKTQLEPDGSPELLPMDLNEPIALVDDLNGILAEFRSLTINELEKISTIIQNSKAFLPQYNGNNRDGLSLSDYHSKALLDALSLSTLNQIIQLLKDNIAQLKLLLIKLGTVPESHLSVAEMVKQSIHRAIAQDADFLSITSSEALKLLNKTIAFLRYFQIEFKSGIVTEVLHQYIGSDTGCTQEYLDNNPTLVRNLIECANTKLQSSTDSLKPMAWFHQAENLKKQMLVELDKYKNSLTHAEDQAAMLMEGSQAQLFL